MITFCKLRHATDNTKDCYVGSTHNLQERICGHKKTCNNPKQRGYNIRVYQYIRANDGYDNWCFDVLEQKDMSKRERYIREGILINQHHATLNVQDPAAVIVNGKPECNRRDSRKHYHTHKEKYKQYNEKTKEDTRQYDKRRSDTDNTCDKCGRTYRGKGSKARHLRTKKCQRLAQQRIQPVINIDGDNNNVTVNMTVNV